MDFWISLFWFLELGTFTEEPEPYSGSISQFSSGDDQIPGIGDGEMPVVPAKSEDSAFTGRLTMTVIHKTTSLLFLALIRRSCCK